MFACSPLTGLWLCSAGDVLAGGTLRGVTLTVGSGYCPERRQWRLWAGYMLGFKRRGTLFKDEMNLKLDQGALVFTMTSDSFHGVGQMQNSAATLSCVREARTLTTASSPR